jgi:TPR repeat protein
MKPFFIAALLLLLNSAAFAGECRVQLEPLLVEQDMKPSPALFEICQSEAEAGDAESLYWVSFFYFGLLESTLDTQRAVQVVNASAEMGYAKAQYWMGWQSEIGGDLPQDLVAALEWYEKAAKSDDWMALDRLERAYRNGELGLEADEAKAQQYAELDKCSTLNSRLHNKSFKFVPPAAQAPLN